MYVIRDENAVYFLHICKKQKDRAEKQELEKAKQRAKSLKLPQEDNVGVIKVDMTQEKKKLEELLANDDAAKKAYDEFQAKIAFQEQVIRMRKSENIASPDGYMSRNEVNNCVDRLCKKYDRAFKELAK